MDITRLINLILRNLLAIVILLSFGLASAVYVTSRATPIYGGISTIFVATPPEVSSIVGSSKIGDLTTGNTFGQARVKSYASIVNNPTTLENLIKKRGLRYSVEELTKKIQAREIPGTVLIQISAQDENPKVAKNIANWVALEFAETVRSLELSSNVSEDKLLKVNLIRTAFINYTPIYPRKLFNYVIGIFLGALLSVIYLLARHKFTQKVRNETNLDGIPLLGSIAFDPAASHSPLIVSTASFSQRFEAYRMVRAALVHELTKLPGKSFVITSCNPNEGKTTGAINIGYSLSLAGLKVIVVETDLRRPSFKDYKNILFSSPNELKSSYEGISALLELNRIKLTEKKFLDSILHSKIDNLDLLQCKKLPPNPSELLEGSKMPLLIQLLEKNYDVVLFDTPPVLSVVDALVLARLVKKVILITHAGKTSIQDFLTAKESLKLLNIDINGVVLNKVPKHKMGDEYGYSTKGYKYSSYSFLYNSDQVESTDKKTFILGRIHRLLSVFRHIEKEGPQNENYSDFVEAEIKRIKSKMLG